MPPVDKLYCTCDQWKLNLNDPTLLALFKTASANNPQHCPFCGTKLKIEHVLEVQDSIINSSSKIGRQ